MWAERRFIPAGFFVAALLLALSFFLHAVVEHKHPGEHAASGTTAFHHEDRKLFLGAVTVCLIAFGFAFASATGSFLPLLVARTKRWVFLHPPDVVDPLSAALRRGIIHPKLCG